MRYRVCCSADWNCEYALKKYPILNQYDPIIDYPYPNPEVSRLTLEVPDLIKFHNDVGQEIILRKDWHFEHNETQLYTLEIYDDYRE